MGMASQICEREDNIITPDLRGFVFGLLDFNRRDLMALNIQVQSGQIELLLNNFSRVFRDIRKSVINKSIKNIYF